MPVGVLKGTSGTASRWEREAEGPRCRTPLTLLSSRLVRPESGKRSGASPSSAPWPEPTAEGVSRNVTKVGGISGGLGTLVLEFPLRQK